MGRIIVFDYGIDDYMGIEVPDSDDLQGLEYAVAKAIINEITDLYVVHGSDDYTKLVSELYDGWMEPSYSVDGFEILSEAGYLYLDLTATFYGVTVPVWVDITNISFESEVDNNTILLESSDYKNPEYKHDSDKPKIEEGKVLGPEEDDEDDKEPLFSEGADGPITIDNVYKRRKKLKKNEFMALWSGDAWRKNKHFLEGYLGKKYEALQVGDEVALYKNANEQSDFLVLYEIVFIDNKTIELFLPDERVPSLAESRKSLKEAAWESIQTPVGDDDWIVYFSDKYIGFGEYNEIPAITAKDLVELSLPDKCILMTVTHYTLTVFKYTKSNVGEELEMLEGVNDRGRFEPDYAGRYPFTREWFESLGYSILGVIYGVPSGGLETSERVLSLAESKKLGTSKVVVGDTIEIINMEGESHYNGRRGVVKSIDSIGQLHGTWGGLAVVPEVDTFKVIKKVDESDGKRLGKFNESIDSKLSTNRGGTIYTIEALQDILEGFRSNLKVDSCKFGTSPKGNTIVYEERKDGHNKAVDGKYYARIGTIAPLSQKLWEEIRDRGLWVDFGLDESKDTSTSVLSVLEQYDAESHLDSGGPSITLINKDDNHFEAWFKDKSYEECEDWSSYTFKTGRRSDAFKQYLRDRGIYFEPSQDGEYTHFEVKNADEAVDRRANEIVRQLKDSITDYVRNPDLYTSKKD